MDVSKLQERLTPKKIKPIAAIVIVEVMLFLFSFESMLEWFNISPKLFILFMVIASYMVFVVIHYIRQPEDKQSVIQSAMQPLVLGRVVLSIVVFASFFVLYVICLPEYKVIAITGYSEGQFSKSKLEMFTNQAYLDELSKEVQTFIGPQYRVKVDDNVRDTSMKSRLIVVPGIFNHEKAVETIIKLEERLAYFCDSEEEHQMPNFADLYKKLKKVEFNKDDLDIVFIKKQIAFLDSSNNIKQSAWRRFWNKLKYILNI